MGLLAEAVSRAQLNRKVPDMPSWNEDWLWSWGALSVAVLDSGTHVLWRQVRWFSLPSISRK
jgi:hypothetical protein